MFPSPLDTLTDGERDALEAHIETVRHQAGDCIFQIGSEGDSCYIVEQGTVRIAVENDDEHPDDRHDVLTFLEPGALLGEMALLDQLPRSASAYAHTDVTLRRISAASIAALTRGHPAVALSIYQALGRSASVKLRGNVDRLVDLVFPKVDRTVDEFVERGLVAQRAFAEWPEERVDRLLLDMAQSIAAEAEALAVETVSETGIGNVPDKIAKNQFASLGVYQSLAGKVGAGQMDADDRREIVSIASPVGVVFGLLPVTNPVSTFIFKALICLKARNALIASPNSRALGISNRTGALIRAALERHGAPLDLVQWISSRPNRKTTLAFMAHPKIGLVLATGGPSMVKAAYSSGNPAIGVGSGNAPALVCPDADPAAVAQAVVLSKSFDNGLICGAEHNLVVVESMYDRFVAELEQAGAAVLTSAEAAIVMRAAVDRSTRRFVPQIIGQDAAKLAAMVGLRRPFPIRVIVVPTDDLSDENPLAREKMAPVLSLYRVPDIDAGLAVSQRLLQIDGTGHTAIIHSRDEELIGRFAALMPASRILVNSPGTHGVVGMATSLAPSLTLGCGTFGGTSTTDNVTYTHLLNVKRLAYASRAAGQQPG